MHQMSRHLIFKFNKIICNLSNPTLNFIYLLVISVGLVPIVFDFLSRSLWTCTNNELRIDYIFC